MFALEIGQPLHHLLAAAVAVPGVSCESLPAEALLALLALLFALRPLSNKR